MATGSGKPLSIPSLFSVMGKIALVSGGGSGIGEMIASAFVNNGAKVYIVSRKEKQLQQVAERLTREGPGSCHYIVGDLSSRAGCSAVVEKFTKRESKLNILVNNSGASWGAPFDDFPEKEGWDRVMSLNVKSIFYMTSLLSPYLAKDASNIDPNRVINISSTAGLSPLAEGSGLSDGGMGLWSYLSSKAAVNHLTSQLAVSLSPKHITVNAILPGVFPSKMTAWLLKQPDNEKKLVKAQPMGRLGTSADMAGLALFLASPASAHITGSHIVIDGGALIYAPLTGRMYGKL